MRSIVRSLSHCYEQQQSLSPSSSSTTNEEEEEDGDNDGACCNCHKNMLINRHKNGSFFIFISPSFCCASVVVPSAYKTLYSRHYLYCTIHNK